MLGLFWIVLLSVVTVVLKAGWSRADSTEPFIVLSNIPIAVIGSRPVDPILGMTGV